MADVIYPTAAEYRGPWLLDRNALEEFDQLIEEGWEQLNRAADERTARRVEELVGEYISEHPKAEADDIAQQRAWWEKRYSDQTFERRHRNLVVRFGDGKTIEAQSFSEVATDHRIIGDVPTGFAMSLACGNVTSETTLSRYLLQLRVSPQGNELASDFFGSLNDWARRHRPPVWQSVWRNVVGLHWLLLMGLLVVLAGVAALTTSHGITAKQQAHELLAHGLQAADEHRALELTLRLVSEMDDSETPVPRWFWWTLGSSLILAVVLSVAPPAVILSLGAGEAKLKRWKLWLRFISVSVPVFMATTIVGFYVWDMLPHLSMASVPATKP